MKQICTAYKWCISFAKQFDIHLIFTRKKKRNCAKNYKRAVIIIDYKSIVYLYDFRWEDFSISSFACLFYLYTIFSCIAHSKDNPMSKHNLYYYRCAANNFD